ncbi:protein of unknown function [Bradyrhizobium vignae]|uniref:Uncharacterized protein n=1 Tax=Bradyrhizobium vignae TaxID=1549949 RepID=A0A2U3PU48_9BRAD|nr:protein of unknown function [Bradyrhizobium vignae]
MNANHDEIRVRCLFRTIFAPDHWLCWDLCSAPAGDDATLDWRPVQSFGLRCANLTFGNDLQHYCLYQE